MTCNGRSNMFVTELVIERTTAVTSERYALSTKCVVEERPARPTPLVATGEQH